LRKIAGTINVTVSGELCRRIEKSMASFPRLPNGGLPMAITRLLSTGKNGSFFSEKLLFLFRRHPGRCQCRPAAQLATNRKTTPSPPTTDGMRPPMSSSPTRRL